MMIRHVFMMIRHVLTIISRECKNDHTPSPSRGERVGVRVNITRVSLPSFPSRPKSAKNFKNLPNAAARQVGKSAKGRFECFSLARLIFQATVCLVIISRPCSGSIGRPTGVVVRSTVSHYSIRASVFIIGDIGEVGRMTIEEHAQQDENMIEKVLRLAGHSTPEQIKKGRDIGGEFRMVKRFPLDTRGRIDWPAVEEGRDVECLHSGFLKQNQKTESEKVVIYPDRAVACREDGSEKTLQGNFGSILSLLEYFIDNEIHAGDVYDSKFILGQHPYIFKCEVAGPALLKPFNTRAYLIDVTTFDGVLKDSRGQPKVRKKKGGIRIWLSKEEPIRNRVLRMSIRYKWYLTLNIELAQCR